MKNRTAAILLALLFILIQFAGARMHEEVHKSIYESYGAENISIAYHWWGMDTTAYGVCNDSCKLANSINESIGYNLQAVNVMIFIGIFFWILLREEKE